MQTLKKSISDLIFFLILILLAIYLTPVFLIGGIIYVFYRVNKFFLRRKILNQVQSSWFPKGKNVLFVYSNRKIWKDYFETNLIPKIQNKSIIINWSNRHQNGWDKNSLEAKALNAFRPSYNFYPLVIVFDTQKAVKVFPLYDSFLKKIKSNSKEYQDIESQILKLIT